MADQPQSSDDPDATAPAPRSTPTVVAGHTQTVRVRRAPKIPVFLLLGAALGILTAMILTFAFDGTQNPAANGAVYSPGQVFGFLALICGAAGLALGGLVAIILDRTVGRRSRDVRVDHESVHPAE